MGSKPATFCSTKYQQCDPIGSISTAPARAQAHHQSSDCSGKRRLGKWSHLGVKNGAYIHSLKFQQQVCICK